MPDRSRRRAAAARLGGRRRADELANRLGVALRGSRRALGLRQVDVADRSGVSQGWVSRMERGSGRTAPLETWAAVALAAGRQLAAFLEEQSGAIGPRDYQHLKRQDLVLAAARGGGWSGVPEALVDPGWSRPRSIDVLLQRPARRELAVVEIWDLFDDVGAAWRGLDAKVAAVARARPEWAVSGLMIVRGTRRNRELVRELGTVFRARHPASSGAWLTALTSAARMPADRGFLWTDVAGTRLIPARL